MFTFNSSDWLSWWLAALAILLLIASYLDKSAALRGTYGQPPPWLADKILRLFFFCVLVAPTLSLSGFLVIPYLAYLPTYLDGSERNGGRPNDWVSTWRIWLWLRARFSAEVVLTGPLDAKRKFIFGLHPHGILPIAGMMNFQSPERKTATPGLQIRSLAASFVFYLPIYRDFCLAIGVCDASRYSARKLLDDGYSILLVPGGATEALYAKPKCNAVYLKKRLGFVKLAMQTGAALVPSYSFGENDTFDQIDTNNKAVQWAKHKFQRVFGISLPLLKNIFPRKCRVVTVIGTPVEFPKVEAPTPEEVQAGLEAYTRALQTLFDKYKPLYSPESTPLTII